MLDPSHVSGTNIANTFSLWLASSLLKKLDLLIYNLRTIKLTLFVYGFMNFDKVIHVTTATKIKIQNSSFTLKKFPRAPWQVTQLLMLSSWQPLTCSLFSDLVFPESFWVCGVIKCVAHCVRQQNTFKICCCVYYNLFLLMSGWDSIVWMYRSLLNHPPVEGHLVCFQFLAVMREAAINFFLFFSWGNT